MIKIYRVYYTASRDNWEEHKTHEYTFTSDETHAKAIISRKNKEDYGREQFDYEEIEVESLENTLNEFIQEFLERSFKDEFKIGECWYCHEFKILMKEDAENICKKCNENFG